MFSDADLGHIASSNSLESLLGPDLVTRFGQAFMAARAPESQPQEAPVAILGPSITVACQTEGCVNHGMGGPDRVRGDR